MSGGCARVRRPGSETRPIVYFSTMNCSGVSARSIWSAWCWFTSATRAAPLRTTSPDVGARSPRSILTKVVLPLPFSPNRTMRDFESIENSAPENSGAVDPG